jgi:hypothetical protein
MCIGKFLFKTGVRNFVTKRAKLLRTYSLSKEACGNEALAENCVLNGTSILKARES